MRMTYGIAYSLGLDAANQQMHQAGRTAWNEEDAALAARTLNELFPLCYELPGIEPAACGCEKCVLLTAEEEIRSPVGHRALCPA